MARLVFTNDASSLLAASIDDNDVTIQVDSGDGALFPTPGAGQLFKLALVNEMGDLEICHCTARLGDLLTVVRGQEGTSAQAWTNGATRVELRVTAGTMEEMLQKTGDTMTGDLNMGDNEIVDARLTGDTVIEGGQTVGTAIRGTEDDGSNEILVPSDGSRATAGGSPLVVQADNLMTLLPIGTILMWYGSLGALPAGWQNCDGTNGSPDLRGSFPRGAGGALALGATGGAATSSGNTDSGGGHSHTGTADPTALTIAQLPDHDHGGWTGHNYERGIGAGSYNPAGFRHGPVVPGYSRNDGLSLDTVGVNSGTTPDGNPLTRGIPAHAGAAEGHSHAVTVDAVGGHTHPISALPIIPPYKAVYFIMKVS